MNASLTVSRCMWEGWDPSIFPDQKGSFLNSRNWCNELSQLIVKHPDLGSCGIQIKKHFFAKTETLKNGNALVN